jgi:DNA polymerase-1
VLTRNKSCGMLALLMTALNFDSLSPPMKVRVLTSNADLPILQDFFSRVKVFGFDVETNIHESFTRRKLRTIQVGNRDEQYVIDLLAFAGSPEALSQQGNRTCPEWAVPLAEVLETALDSNQWVKVGFNLQFDYEAVLWNLGVYSWNFHDCMLAEKVIHAGAVNYFEAGFWGAEDITLRYTGLKIDKTLQKSFDLSSPLTPEQVNYAALDTRLPVAILGAQQQMLDKHKLCLAVKIENDAIPAFGDMHLNGIKLSSEKWLDIVNSNQDQHKQNITLLDRYFLPIVGPKDKPEIDVESFEKAWRGETDREARAQYRKRFQEANRQLREWEKNVDTYEGEAAINYGSQVQLLKTFRSMGISEKQLPDTSDRTLKKLSDKYPAVAALAKYRKTLKVLTTYGTAFINDNVNPDTLRVHSKINQLGAATGRTTSSAPNIQNSPRGSAWRACFVAESGWKMITVDYNGCELRILAEISGEIGWIEAFNKGWDVHSYGAEILFGDRWKNAAQDDCAYYFTGDHQKCSCKEHKKLRDQVKAINFGIAYGMEAGKLSDSLGITKVEAQQLLDKYRSTFKRVTKYLSDSGQNARMSLVCRTLSGRWRRFQAPTDEKIREIAEEDAKKFGKQPDYGRARNVLYGSIEREGKNTPIQGTNADMIKLAMGCGFDSEGRGFLWHKTRETNSRIVNVVHDELVVEAREEVADSVYAMVGDCMQRAGEVFVKKVPVLYEGHVADEWSK